jgi:hypothetical protein
MRKLAASKAPKSEFDQSMDEGTNAVIGTGIGAGLGFGAKEAGKLGYKAATSVGPLSREQVEIIEANPDGYKSAPKLEQILNDWKEMGKKTQQTGLDAASDARQSLQGLPNIPVGNYYEALSKEPSDIKYSTAIDPGTRAKITQDAFKAVEPEINDLSAQDKSITQRLMQNEYEQNMPFQDERLSLKENQTNQIFDRKAAQLEDVPQPSREEQAISKYNTLKEERQLQRIDEKIAKKTLKAQAGSTSAQEALIEATNKKEDFLHNQTNRAEKDTSVQTAKGNKAVAGVDQKKSELEFRKVLTDEKLAQDKALKEQARLEKLLKEKETLEAKRQDIHKKIQKKTDGAAKEAKKQYSKVANIPEEISVPEDRYLRPEYSKQLEGAVAKARPATEAGLEPIVVDQLVQELREGSDFDGKAGPIKNFNNGLSENVRRDVLNEKDYPVYNEKMGLSSNAQNIQDQMATTTGLEFDKSPDNVRFADGARNKLGQALLDRKSAINTAEELDGIFSNLVKNGIVTPQEAQAFMQNGQYAAIKTAVETGAKDITGYDIANMTKGPTAIKAGIGQYGGKIQEMLAQFAGGTGGKIASKIGDSLPYVGGAFGLAAGLATAANASDEGLITPEQEAFAGPMTMLDPPLTDSVQSAIDMNKSYNDAKAQGDGELMSNVKAAGGAISGFVKPFTEGASSVVPSIDKLAEMGVRGVMDTMESVGKDQSNAARDRMEKRMGNSPVIEQSKSLKQATPEQLMQLMESFKNIKGAEIFVAPLEQAAQAETEEDRQGRLFGLYQQPAFRQLLKKKIQPM